jgi:transcriptional regulator with PAS, ATPase and Fis domain
MRRLYGLLDKVGPSDATVLIQGDNGTGKELVARAVHAGSTRTQGPFVVTNCSAFNDNLLDSELFGHRRGAFTGAVADKPGLFDLADKGTFFLDEIGDTSPALQVKLLRVLQEGTFLPVGGTRTRQVDVRVLAATNRDLTAMIRDGTFRQDLYYRLHVISLLLPPLVSRGEDVALLAEHFLTGHTGRRRVGRKRLSDGAMELLQAHDWPGNVRELENEIERLVVMSGDARVITEDLLSPRIRQRAAWGGRVGGVPLSIDEANSLPEAVQALERTMIRDALNRSRWNKTQAAKALGISRRNLIRKVQGYDLEPRRPR